MKKFQRLIVFLVVATVLLSAFLLPVSAEKAGASLSLDCKSAVLMEAQTGKILYAQNESQPLPPASVTKVMTLLLVMEAIERGQIKYTDMVSASEHACSMGGSQIYLEVGEQMSVEDLLKSVVIASANDAAVALAEQVAGTEEAFVEQMNARAKELGMTDTVFENTNGLDDTTDTHLTSAKDIAIMSRELIKYPKITKYSRIWMDTIRNGEFGLTNTNRLIRFYEGATGLKTGSTAKAGFCITATAKRGDMTLIAVIMGADTRDSRNAAAVSLLNYGFSNYSIYKHQYKDLADIKVLKGMEDSCSLVAEEFVTVIPKKKSANVKTSVSVQPNIIAPFSIESEVGEVIYTLDGEELGRVKILTEHGVEKINFWRIFVRIFSKMLLK